MKPLKILRLLGLFSTAMLMIMVFWSFNINRLAKRKSSLDFSDIANSTVGNSLNSTVYTTQATISCNSFQMPLVGALKTDLEGLEVEYKAVKQEHGHIEVKSFHLFRPRYCKPEIKIAIIIPFRDREEHLQYLLGRLHPFLTRQHASFQIFVIEQSGNGTFNKGRLMNTGYYFARNESRKHNNPFDCYVFHDVDMMPENDKNMYSCIPGSNLVNHLACSVNKFNYNALCCGMTVGGVLMFTPDQFNKTNGFSNRYWGWGGEDDDMNVRIRVNGMTVKRNSDHTICRYTMIEHKRDTLNPYVEETVNDRVKTASDKAGVDGLTNLNTTILSVQWTSLYVRVLVDVGTPHWSVAKILAQPDT